MFLLLHLFYRLFSSPKQSKNGWFLTRWFSCRIWVKKVTCPTVKSWGRWHLFQHFHFGINQFGSWRHKNCLKAFPSRFHDGRLVGGKPRKKCENCQMGIIVLASCSHHCSSTTLLWKHGLVTGVSFEEAVCVGHTLRSNSKVIIRKPFTLEFQVYGQSFCLSKISKTPLVHNSS